MCSHRLPKFRSLFPLVLLLVPVVLFTQSYVGFRNPSWLLGCVQDEIENHPPPPTNLNHVMFVLVGSVAGWRHRRPYVEAWWRPNLTRGNLFLDVEPTPEFLPWPHTSPPFQVNEDLTKFPIYHKLSNPIHIRIYRSILETYRLKRDEGVRWYLMGDEDSLFFIDNIVDVLAGYDHHQYRYVGMHSETLGSNTRLSFDMAYGGAGYALSYPLVEALVTRLDDCIERYHYISAGDQLQSACLADLGVDIIKEKGFHQMDLRGDVSGFLSSHSSSPLLSLHHFKFLDPLFPGLSRTGSVGHLMKAGSVDQTRILQQSVCHCRPTNWTFSVSWGYSAHIYENIFPRSYLRLPIQTFKPWIRGRPPHFMFNTRKNSRDPCHAPHWFFFKSVSQKSRFGMVTSYVRNSARNISTCSSTGNHSAEHVTKIRVTSPRKAKHVGMVECCDIEYTGKELVNIRLRDCRKREVIV